MLGGTDRGLQGSVLGASGQEPGRLTAGSALLTEPQGQAAAEVMSSQDSAQSRGAQGRVAAPPNRVKRTGRREGRGTGMLGQARRQTPEGRVRRGEGRSGA